MYNPDRQVDFAVNEKTTIMSDYSTLDMLNMAYGKSSSAEWLTIHLAELNTFSGSKKMDDNQTKSLSKILAQEYKDMKYSVIMLFFYKFKCGYFGKLWGKVDPMAITCSLREFIAECCKKRQEYLNEEHAELQLQNNAKMELRHKAEGRWWRCQEYLSDYCRKKSFDDVFSRLELVAFNCDSNTLLLRATRKDYNLIEGKYLKIFTKGFHIFFQNVRVLYQITEHTKVQVNKSDKDKKKLLMEREREYAIGNAKRIIANDFDLDKESVQRMIYAFQLRYKHSPEEYLKLYEPKE
ncbi:MAG: DUF6633 family protein [Prevotella sp.]